MRALLVGQRGLSEKEKAIMQSKSIPDRLYTVESTIQAYGETLEVIWLRSEQPSPGLSEWPGLEGYQPKTRDWTSDEWERLIANYWGLEDAAQEGEAEAELLQSLIDRLEQLFTLEEAEALASSLDGQDWAVTKLETRIREASLPLAGEGWICPLSRNDFDSLWWPVLGYDCPPEETLSFSLDIAADSALLGKVEDRVLGQAQHEAGKQFSLSIAGPDTNSLADRPLGAILEQAIAKLKDAPSLEQIVEEGAGDWHEVLDALSPYLADEALELLDTALDMVVILLHAEYEAMPEVNLAELSYAIQAEQQAREDRQATESEPSRPSLRLL